MVVLMADKKNDAFERAKVEVLTLLKAMKKDENPSVDGLLNEDLIVEMLKSGLTMQFDSSPQKIKQSIKLLIRASIRSNK